MSWPIRTSDIAAAFARRPETDIWLSIWRSDEVKEWARADFKKANAGDAPLLKCEYTAKSVEWKADLCKMRWHSKPAWFGLDDPALISCRSLSIPNTLMRDGGLSKDRTAEVFAHLIATGLSDLQTITQHDWRLTISLDAPKRRLLTRSFRRATREWRLTEEHSIALGD